MNKKEMFEQICRKLNIEIYQCVGKNMYGLKWGEGKMARLIGMKRKDTINALNWADNNNKEAEEIIASLKI